MRQRQNPQRNSRKMPGGLRRYPVTVGALALPSRDSGHFFSYIILNIRVQDKIRGKYHEIFTKNRIQADSRIDGEYVSLASEGLVDFDV